MFSGFLLPVYITRSLSEYSDSIFFYLSILNPVIIFLGFDQRKLIILGTEVSDKIQTAIRSNSLIILFLMSSLLLFGLNSLFFFSILFLKMISFSLDLHNGILQNNGDFLSLLVLRTIEMLILILLIFIDFKYSFFLLVPYFFYLIYTWKPNINLTIINFIKTNYSLGLQGTLTAISSALGIYLLKLTGNNNLITELAVQTTILSSVYIAQSIYLNSIMDRFKKMGSSKTSFNLLIINLIFIFGAVILFYLFHFFNFFEFIFDKKVNFSFLSVYIFCFIILHMLKNSQFIFSFLIKKSIEISKVKIFITLFYIFPLILPLSLSIKLSCILIISLLEFLIVFKFIKK